MEIDFNRMSECSQQLRNIAMRLRQKIYETDGLKQEIAEHSVTAEVVRALASTEEKLENESFFLIEMSNMLGDISAFYRQTETEICDSFRQASVAIKPLKPFNVGNINNDLKNYFKL